MIDDNQTRRELLEKLAKLQEADPASGNANLLSRLVLVLEEAIKRDAPPEVVASAKRLAAMVLERGVPRSKELSDLLHTVINVLPKSKLPSHANPETKRSQMRGWLLALLPVALIAYFLIYPNQFTKFLALLRYYLV